MSHLKAERKDNSTEIIGTLEQRYQLFEKIGAGGMGTVYKAFDLQLDRWVAVKVLSGWQSTPPAAEIQRLQREAKALAKLDHINILKLLDFGVDKGKPFLVMELIEGKSVDQLLKRDKRFPISGAILVADQICEGMSQAHRAGILHRDLKPSNILIVDDGEKDIVKIIDLGLASLETDSQKITRTGVAIGSPLYMSPEQVNGRDIDSRSDIYSLGCMLFAMITGKPPFYGDTALDTMAMHLSQQPTSLSESRNDIPVASEIETIVKTCLDKNPDNRFQSMVELRTALSEISEEAIRISEATPVASSEEHPVSTKLKNKKVIALSIIAVMLLLLMVPYMVQKATKLEPKLAIVSTSDKSSVAPILHYLSASKLNIAGDTCSTNMDSNDESFRRLEGNKKITRLSIKTSDVKGSGLKYVNPELKILIIRESDFDDTGAEQLPRFKSLDRLEIVNCPYLTNKGFEKITQIPHLDSLIFETNKLSLEQMHIIGQLKTIRGLSLCSRDEPFPTGYAGELVNFKNDLQLTLQRQVSAENLKELKKCSNIGLLLLKNIKIDRERMKALAELPVTNISFMYCPIESGALLELGSKKPDALFLTLYDDDHDKLRAQINSLKKKRPKFCFEFKHDLP